MYVAADAANAAADAAMRAALVTQRKTRRRTKLHPQKQRSKYLCRPEAVVEAGNHFVWEFVPGRGALNVPADAGILHHYRVCEFGGDDCVKTPSTVDRTAHRHGATLVARVRERYAEMRAECGLLEVPAAPTRAPQVVARIKAMSVVEKAAEAAAAAEPAKAST